MAIFVLVCSTVVLLLLLPPPLLLLVVLLLLLLLVVVVVVVGRATRCCCTCNWPPSQAAFTFPLSFSLAFVLFVQLRRSSFIRVLFL